MRDILTTFKLLQESTGLANRKPGDIFKNPKGDQLYYKSISFYPESGGKYNSSDLTDELTNLNKSKQVIWQNKKTSKTGGFIVVTFDSNEGELNFGFYKDDIKPNKRDNFIANKVDDYSFAGKSAEKIKTGLTPQDLLVKRDNLTSIEIIDQLSEKLGADNVLVEVTRRLAMGEELPISFEAPPNLSFTGFRDYFCEILQPIALQVGSYTGNAGEAAEIFLGGSFEDTLISFDAAKNAGLSDSILTNSEGKSIKISTKGGEGAQASAKNLLDSVNELNQTPAGQKLLDKHQETVDLLKEIQKQGQIKAPLYLGVKFDIITEDDAKTILKLRNLKPIDLEDIYKMDLSNNILQLAKTRKPDDPKNLNLFFHLLACVANAAANEVNKQTNFSDAAAEILNNGALVQVYTKAKQNKNIWVLEEFNTLYPSKNIKGVYLSAAKNYFSTGVKGNLTFKIDRGSGAKDITADQPKGLADKEIDFAKAAKSIATGVGKPISMEPKDVMGVGREKR